MDAMSIIKAILASRQGGVPSYSTGGQGAQDIRGATAFKPLLSGTGSPVGAVRVRDFDPHHGGSMGVQGPGGGGLSTGINLFSSLANKATSTPDPTPMPLSGGGPPRGNIDTPRGYDMAGVASVPFNPAALPAGVPLPSQSPGDVSVPPGQSGYQWTSQNGELQSGSTNPAENPEDELLKVSRMKQEMILQQLMNQRHGYSGTPAGFQYPSPNAAMPPDHYTLPLVRY